MSERTIALPPRKPRAPSLKICEVCATTRPVIPIAIDSGMVWPKKGPKQAGTVTFRFGEAIPAGLPREAAEARVHAAINALDVKA